MRAQKRNKQEFWYANFVEKRPVVQADESGNEVLTGEWETVYTIPFKTEGNISAAKGETETRLFGESLDYDRVIFLDVPNTLINEFSIIWADTFPVFNEHGMNPVPHDYVVKRVARSINSVLIAISKVDVSETSVWIKE